MLNPGTFGYEETKRAAKALAEMGCDIITGDGPGLMRAANEGASRAPERSRSYGIRVELPFEQNVNAFVSQAFEHRTFFTRLHQFVITSDAFIVAPGGVGTLLEMVMITDLSGQDMAGTARMGEVVYVVNGSATCQPEGPDRSCLRARRR